MDDRKCLITFENRLKAIKDGKGKEITMVQLRKHCKANLLKPQRLVSLNPNEEKARYHLTMRLHDRVLYLAC